MRDRIWIIAHNNSRRRGIQSFNENLKNEAHIINDGKKKSLAYPDHAGLQTTWPEFKTKRIKFVDAWKTEPGMGRVVDGIPNRVDRIKCLGNAIVPQISCWIANRIKEVEARAEEGESK
jgi:site-specific DNA-cytosine methylase